MANTFLRKYSIIIGDNTEVKGTVLPKFHGEYLERKKQVRIDGIVYSTEAPLSLRFLDSYKDFNTIPPRSIEITDLQIEAQIIDNKNFDKQSSQKTTIKIFNLSEKSRNFIKSGDSIFLKGGYANDAELPLLYIGHITYVSSRKDGNGNIVTEIFSNPYDMVNNIKISKTYEPNVTLRYILKDLAAIIASKGIPTGEVVLDEVGVNSPERASIFDKIYYSGYAVKGNLLDVLSRLCSENNLRSYIILGRLYIQYKASTSYAQVIDVEEMHLKSTIEREDDKGGKEILADTPITGITLRLLLNGQITSNTLIRLKVTDFSGNYLVKSVKHKLNFEGHDWDTEIQCEKVKT